MENKTKLEKIKKEFEYGKFGFCDCCYKGTITTYFRTKKEKGVMLCEECALKYNSQIKEIK